MQVLKEDMRRALLEQGTLEFLARGFSGASVRRIAKEAGTTIGNFYNYFSSKEELFDTIVTPVHQSLQHFLLQHDQQATPVTVIQYLQRHEAAFSKGFLLLFESSQGTRFESVKGDFIRSLAQHAAEHLTGRDAHTQFPLVIATSFVEGVLTILKTSSTQEDTLQMLSDYILFFIRGIGTK